MCDGHAAADDAEPLCSAMSRRSFGVATAAAGAMLVLPVAANALPVTGQQPELTRGRKDMEAGPVIRISILRCDAAQFDEFRRMSSESEAALRPGIERMPGLLAFYAGADPMTCSFTNTSLWDTLEHAQQLDRFQPMLDAGKRFAAAGAKFEKPIMNYTPLWHFEPRPEPQG